jgi:hypothetical protein
MRDSINAESARLDQKIKELAQQIAKAPTQAQLDERRREREKIAAKSLGLVILGFFVLSFRDEAIRRAIFSGQTGIQFLTLFSIVIAIILIRYHQHSS